MRAACTTSALLAGLCIGRTTPRLGALAESDYSPPENLEVLDARLLRDARQSIDLLVYLLSDDALIEAIEHLAYGGVPVRIYLDAEQLVQVLTHSRSAQAETAQDPYVRKYNTPIDGGGQ
jgi:phosphatidylserine/phosphatidylglycerophosphate/cardiolipin synthase-like enzyme